MVRASRSGRPRCALHQQLDAFVNFSSFWPSQFTTPYLWVNGQHAAATSNAAQPVSGARAHRAGTFTVCADPVTTAQSRAVIHVTPHGCISTALVVAGLAVRLLIPRRRRRPPGIPVRCPGTLFGSRTPTSPPHWRRWWPQQPDPELDAPVTRGRMGRGMVEGVKVTVARAGGASRAACSASGDLSVILRCGPYCCRCPLLDVARRHPGVVCRQVRLGLAEMGHDPGVIVIDCIIQDRRMRDCDLSGPGVPSSRWPRWPASALRSVQATTPWESRPTASASRPPRPSGR